LYTSYRNILVLYITVATHGHSAIYILLIKALRVACLFLVLPSVNLDHSLHPGRSDRAPPPPQPSLLLATTPPHPSSCRHCPAHPSAATPTRPIHRQQPATATTRLRAVSPSPSPPSLWARSALTRSRRPSSWTCRRPTRAGSASRSSRPSPSRPRASPHSPTPSCARAPQRCRQLGRGARATLHHCRGPAGGARRRDAPSWALW
jgi:hypothetical protein